MEKENLKKWLKNLLVFSSPALIVFLTAVASGVKIQDAAYLMVPVICNAAIDFLKKLSV